MKQTLFMLMGALLLIGKSGAWAQTFTPSGEVTIPETQLIEAGKTLSYGIESALYSLEDDRSRAGQVDPSSLASKEQCGYWAYSEIAKIQPFDAQGQIQSFNSRLTSIYGQLRSLTEENDSAQCDVNTMYSYHNHAAGRHLCHDVGYSLPEGNSGWPCYSEEVYYVGMPLGFRYILHTPPCKWNRNRINKSISQLNQTASTVDNIRKKIEQISSDWDAAVNAVIGNLPSEPHANFPSAASSAQASAMQTKKTLLSARYNMDVMLNNIDTALYNGLYPKGKPRFTQVEQDFVNQPPGCPQH